MIFVTVGTHEQQFNRLVQAVDHLKKNGNIKDDVYIQTGFSTYFPQYCDYSKFLGYESVNDFVQNSDIIVTHGGPASFMNAISKKKKPIVVPRLSRFQEHVNDHQLYFAKKYIEVATKEDFYLVEDINDLNRLIQEELHRNSSDNIVSESREHSIFVEKFSTIIEELMK